MMYQYMTNSNSNARLSGWTLGKVFQHVAQNLLVVLQTQSAYK